MKTNCTHEVIARIARPGLVLGAVFALVISGSSVGRAQSSATSPAVPAATSAKAAPSAHPGQPATPAKRQPGGTHEGSKVHGHWVIEVKNPDGKLVRHVEFENSLDPGFNLAIQIARATNIPGGAALLNAMLSGQASPDGNSWGIMLVGPAGLASLDNGANGVCSASINNSSISGANYPLDACMLFPKSATVNANLSPIITYTSCSAAGISCSVVSTPLGTAPNLTGFQLSGSVTATETGQIGTVATVSYEPCGSLPSSSCPLSTAVPVIESGTTYYLNMVSFTSTPLSSQINVVAGQSVNVSVTISFQ